MQAFIKLDDDLHTVHSAVACTGDAPSHTVKQGSAYKLAVAFSTAGVQGALADGTTGRLYLRKTGTAGEPQLVADSWTREGTGSSTVYKFDALLATPGIISQLASADNVGFDVEIEWRLPTESQPRKSVGHTLTIKRSVGSVQSTSSVAAVLGRVLYVDDNYTDLIARGFAAYENLAAAWDAAVALTPSASSPVLIRMGARTDDGFTINADVSGVVIQGLSQAVSKITLIEGENYNAAIALENVHVDDLTAITGGSGGGSGLLLALTLVDANVNNLTARSAANFISVFGRGTVGNLNVSGDVSGWGEANSGNVVVSGFIRVSNVDISSATGDGGGLTLDEGAFVSVSVTFAAPSGAPGFITTYQPNLISTPPSAPAAIPGVGILFMDGNTLKLRKPNGTLVTIA